jgi:hypothetical protein
MPAQDKTAKMFSGPLFASFALIANLVGTVLLFYSFQATSSAFRLIKRDLGNAQLEYRICADELTLSKADTRGNMIMNLGPCPPSLDQRPAAIVTIEHESFGPPMSVAELKYPTWKMLHTRRGPTDDENVALRAYGSRYTACAQAQIEVCKLIAEGAQRVDCAIPAFVDSQASQILQVLISGGGTFDSYTCAATAIAAGYEAAAIRALALERAFKAKQK